MDGTETHTDRERSLPIDPGSGLCLTTTDHADGVLHRRFAGLFRDVWEMIPLRHRELLRRHWRDDPYRPIDPSPRIALEPPTAPARWGRRSPRPMRHEIGVCKLHGHEL